MTGRALAWTGARLFVAWVVVSLVALHGGAELIRAIEPWLAFVVELALNGYDARIGLIQEEQDIQIQLLARAIEPIHISGPFGLPPGAEIRTSTHLSHAMIPVVLLLCFLLAWPAAGLRSWLIRGTVAALMAFVLITATTPLLLAGKLEMFYVELASQRGLSYTPGLLVDWTLFMEMGGRWLLPILAAGIVLIPSIPKKPSRLTVDTADGIQTAHETVHHPGTKTMR